MRLALAYEYDPYFTLSIARVDPLPHQLEAVYDYFLRQPRIRFLLADDPGAGKTIMAGLLIKELKIRGLIKRTLIVTPANLTFQWQREMKDKFREGFEIVRGDVLRSMYGSNPWQERNQVITSISWVSRIEDTNESLLRSRWDLIIVDEAHKMSASSPEHKTLAYQLGEALSEMTDHLYGGKTLSRRKNKGIQPRGSRHERHHQIPCNNLTGGLFDQLMQLS
jgi:SNF2 family DNA or RNA helicase